MESAMGSSKRALNTRSQARNARGQFASVKTEVGATAAPKQIILVYSSDSDGAPAPKEKVATSAAAVDKKMFSSVATRTRAVAAGKKSASDAPALTGKKGSATVNKAPPLLLPPSVKCRFEEGFTNACFMFCLDRLGLMCCYD